MVRLYKYFETASAVYLLLEYARGGRLWNHISCYHRHLSDSPERLICDKSNGDYPERTRGDSHGSASSCEVIASAGCRGNDPCDTKQSLQDTKAQMTEDVCNSPVLNLETNVITELSVLGTCSNNGTSSIEVIEDPPSNTCASNTIPVQENTGKSSTNQQAPLTENITNTKQTASLTRSTTKVEDDRKRAGPSVRSYNPHSLFARLDEYYSSCAQSVPEEHVRLWAAEIVLALAYLHASGITCR